MRRATITLDDDLERSLDEFVGAQEIPPTLTALVRAALTEYMSRRGAARPLRRLHITPAKRGSGKSDISVNHDYYLAND
jgi:hypothetical protein